MTQAWNDNARWWLDHQYVSKEARAARELDRAAGLLKVAAGLMTEAGRDGLFGLPAEIRKQALALRFLAEACVAELNEGEKA